MPRGVLLCAAVLVAAAGTGWISLRGPSAALPTSGAEAPETSAAARPAERLPSVVLYTADGCTLYCTRQKQDLAGLGIPWQERNIDRDPRALHDLLDRDDDPVLPTIAAADSLWRGYAETHARAVLHKLRHLDDPERDAPGSDRLRVYTRSDCPFSAQLLDDLDALGLDYDNRVVDRDAEALAELVRLMGQATVPVTVLGGHLWPGYAEEYAREIRARLDRV